MFSISVETDNAFRNYDLDLEHFLNKKLFSSLLQVFALAGLRLLNQNTFRGKEVNNWALSVYS